MLLLSLNAGMYSQGVTWYEQAISFPWWSDSARINLMEIGSALYGMVYAFEKAVNIRREELVLQMRLQKRNHKNTPDTGLVPGAAWTALKDITGMLEQHGLQPFPTAGTLLGWQREGDILPHDKDLDIAFLPGDSIDLARHIITQQPRYQLAPMGVKSSTYLCIHDRETRCTVDLLQFWREGKRWSYGWLLPETYRPQSRVLYFEPFKLIRDTWKDQKFWKPDDADNYLEQLYGDWSNPDPDFDSCAGACNLARMTTLVQSMVYNQIIACISKGKWSKARRLVESLQNQGDTHPVLSQVKDWLGAD
jgi:hypothetical protein